MSKKHPWEKLGGARNLVDRVRKVKGPAPHLAAGMDESALLDH